jgi:hypothetical protein
MLEYVALVWMLWPIVTAMVFGFVAWRAVRRARPEDLPRILEICGQLLRRRPERPEAVRPGTAAVDPASRAGVRREPRLPG